MTVKELIENLKHYPENLPVIAVMYHKGEEVEMSPYIAIERTGQKTHEIVIANKAYAEDLI